MSLKNEPRRERHDLDDAIDRVVRDMTRIEADDAAVSRVMARVRGARHPEMKVGWFGMLPWRPAWGLAAAAVLILILVPLLVWIRKPAPELFLASRPMPAVELPPPIVSAGPIALASGNDIARATTSDGAGRTILATSIVEAANADAASAEAAAADEFHSDLSPREGDLAMGGIAPAPLVESPALAVEPLGMRELTVDSIDPSPITVPSPVGPQR